MRRSLNHEVAGLYAILDFPQREGHEPRALLAAMLAGGARTIQVRSKSAPLDPEMVLALAADCAERDVALILNDELELLERLHDELPGAVGVHLGQSDLRRLGASPNERHDRRAGLAEAGLMLGISTHDSTQLVETLSTYAPDYVGFGPVFATQSKANPEPSVGLEGLARACASSSVPVVAIGGIGQKDLGAVAGTGAAAFAVIGALAAPSLEEVRERASALRDAFVVLR